MFRANEGCLLVDYDAISHSSVSKVISTILNDGRVNLSRIKIFSRFDLESDLFEGKVAVDYHPTPKLVSSGKNAVDISLTVQAMKLLNANFGVFMLMVSDSDYSPLMMELRRLGKKIWVFGNHQTPACVCHLADLFFCYQGRVELREDTNVLPISILVESIKELEDDQSIYRPDEIKSWKRVVTLSYFLKKIYCDKYDCESSDLLRIFELCPNWFCLSVTKNGSFVCLQE